ncbi:MAG: DNA-formamidopyrimidine glycosylase [Chloroflexota bacterium]
MPELPEVETYIRELEPELLHRRVMTASVHWPRIIDAPSHSEFETEIIGQQFTAFNRRGKYMLLGLTADDGVQNTLIVHLRMTGKLQIYTAEASASELDKHTHVTFGLDNGRMLHYRDPRKFGRLWLVDDPESVVYKLGPEPLGDDFTVSDFAEQLGRRKASIKALLLNQSIVAGVGNIYADEALFMSKIHPERAGNSLTEAEIARLHEAVRIVLDKAIRMCGSSLGGSSLQNYSRPGGQQGNFQEDHKVFRRTGQPCVVCGTPITRIVVTQRGTHFCGVCQT